MNRIFLMMLALVPLMVSTTSNCDKKDKRINTEIHEMTGKKISLEINSQIYTATLQDNSTAIAFEEMLPLTIHMIELNGNEKYYDLVSSLPEDSSNPGVIELGGFTIVWQQYFSTIL